MVNHPILFTYQYFLSVDTTFNILTSLDQKENLIFCIFAYIFEYMRARNDARVIPKGVNLIFMMSLTKEHVENRGFIVEAAQPQSASNRIETR